MLQKCKTKLNKNRITLKNFGLTCNNGGTPCFEFKRELRFECVTELSEGSNFTIKFPAWWRSFVLDRNSGWLVNDGGNEYEHWYVERPPLVLSSLIAKTKVRHFLNTLSRKKKQYLPSSLIPRCKHLSKRQAGHFFRVATVTGQTAPLRQT